MNALWINLRNKSPEGWADFLPALQIFIIHIMFKFVAACFSFMLLAIPALANPKAVGYFEGVTGFSGARNRMCIKELPDKRLNVNIASGYCPSKECMNFRPDGLLFQATLKSNAVHYTNKTGCKLDVVFFGDGATVTQNSKCVDDAHPYLYANGSYKFIKAEADENDCAP